MRWVLLWLCACQPHPLVVAACDTRDQCDTVADRLHDTVGGTYVTAQWHTDPVDFGNIYNPGSAQRWPVTLGE